MTGKPARLLLAGCLWLLAGGVVTGLGATLLVGGVL